MVRGTSPSGFYPDGVAPLGPPVPLGPGRPFVGAAEP